MRYRDRRPSRCRLRASARSEEGRAWLNLGCSPAIGIEVLLQSLPATEVVGLQLRAFEREACRANRRTRLEHERHRVDDVMRLAGVRGDRLLERLVIRTVPAHAIVQARAAGDEALCL